MFVAILAQAGAVQASAMPVPSGAPSQISEAFQQVVDLLVQQHAHELAASDKRCQELEADIKRWQDGLHNSGTSLEASPVHKARSEVSTATHSMPLAIKFRLRSLERKKRPVDAARIMEQIGDQEGTSSGVTQFFASRDDTVAQFEQSLESKVLQIDLESDSQQNGFEKLQTWLQSHRYDLVITVLLCLNVLWMAIELQITGSFSGVSIGITSSSLVHIEHREEVKEFFQLGDYIFTGFFTLDVAVRIIVLRWRFWKVCMNYVDFMVTITAILEIILVTSVNSFLFRLLRIGKLARALRLVTLSNTLASLELLTKCLIASVDMLFWTFCLLACVQCVAGMLISGLCREFIEDDNNNLAYREQVFRYYGTFSRTFLSMFEILFANWGPPCRVLVENVSEWFSLFFLLYRCVVGFALLNVVNAVFVQQTMRTASSDEELAFKQKERDVALYTRKVRKLFQSMDDSGDGALNLEEFAKLANSPKLKFWMSQLELEYHDLLSLFEFLDNGDGQITLSEFIEGAGRLRGGAKAIDVWRLETKVEVLIGELIRLINPDYTEGRSFNVDSQALAPVQKIFAESTYHHIHSVAKPRVSVRNAAAAAAQGGSGSGELLTNFRVYDDPAPS